MAHAVKRIGVFTSGGDAPGMNAAIRAVARTSIHLGIECIGIRRGYNGLIQGDVVPLDFNSVGRMLRHGGTMLYSARSDEFRTIAGQEKALNTCKMLGLDGLVGIGGDGTFQGLLALSRMGISVVGIPGTIDNDIPCTDYTIGFDTACNTAIESIDKLGDTMQSHERCSVVEVMGRDAGYLALYEGIACGAICVMVPEVDLDFEKDVIEKIRSARLMGRTHFLVIVAEGVGSGYDIAERIRNATSLDTRVTVLGHVQRGGAPTARDRIVATTMGYNAVNLLAQGETNRLICTRGQDYLDLDIEEGLKMTKHLNMKTYDMMNAISG